MINTAVNTLSVIQTAKSYPLKPKKSYLCRSYYSSIMTFGDLNLNTPLLNALDELGYKRPTTIQQRAFSVIMSGQDVCGIAQTGTGKTFAYLLPTLRQFKFSINTPLC